MLSSIFLDAYPKDRRFEMCGVKLTPKSILTKIPGPGQFEDELLAGFDLSSDVIGDTS
jgi:hypothetical protein